MFKYYLNYIAIILILLAFFSPSNWNCQCMAPVRAALSLEGYLFPSMLLELIVSPRSRPTLNT